MQTAVFASSALGQGTHLSKRIKRCFLSLRWSGFSAARAATTALFQVQFRSVPELSDAALETADIVFLHTTSAKRALSAAEQASVPVAETSQLG